MLHFSEYIRVLRATKNLSTGDIERRSNGGIKDATVSKLENGKTKSMSLDIMEALAKGCGVPLIEMLENYYGYNLTPRESLYNLGDLNSEQRVMVETVTRYLISGIKTGLYLPESPQTVSPLSLDVKEEETEKTDLKEKVF